MRDSYHDKSAPKRKCVAAQQHAQNLITSMLAQRSDHRDVSRVDRKKWLIWRHLMISP
jgi:hypothetical protein